MISFVRESQLNAFVARADETEWWLLSEQSTGRTLLMAAVVRERREFVHYMLENLARRVDSTVAKKYLNRRDSTLLKKSALDLAATKVNARLVEMLCGAGAEPFDRNVRGSALHYAIESVASHFDDEDNQVDQVDDRRFACIDALIDGGVPIKRLSVSGETVLHSAVRCNAVELIGALEERGAERARKDRQGVGALQLAAQLKHWQCARALGGVVVTKVEERRKQRLERKQRLARQQRHIMNQLDKNNADDYGYADDEEPIDGGDDDDDETEPMTLMGGRAHASLAAAASSSLTPPDSLSSDSSASASPVSSPRSGGVAVIDSMKRTAAAALAKRAVAPAASHVGVRLDTEQRAAASKSQLKRVEQEDIRRKDKWIRTLRGRQKKEQDFLADALFYDDDPLPGSKPRSGIDITKFSGIIHTAVLHGDWQLIANFPNEDMLRSTEQGVAPLFLCAFAARDGDQCAAELIEGGAYVNHVNLSNHWTALHAAARRDQLEIVKLLLKHGAKMNAETVDHFTPLDLAVLFGQRRVLRYLYHRNAITLHYRRYPSYLRRKVSNQLAATHSK
jgi:ankyrin repeat protein